MNRATLLEISLSAVFTMRLHNNIMGFCNVANQNLKKNAVKFSRLAEMSRLR